MQRIAWVSDTHLSVPDLASQSLWPNHMSRLPRNDAEVLYGAIVKGIDRAYQAVIDYLRAHGPWDFIGHLGDATGGWQEQGAWHPAMRPHTERLMADLRTIAPVVYVAVGNHDTGYREKSVGYVAGAGMTRESLEVCQQVFGPLFWTHAFPGLVIIGVCTPIARYSGQDEWILKIKRQQQEFVGDNVARLHGNRWILAAHDTGAPTYFTRELAGHEKDCLAFVCGDLHDPRKHRLLRSLWWTKMSRPVRGLTRKGVLCPSTAPLWWHGRGTLTTEWKPQDGSLRMCQIILDRPEEERVPTESFVRCARWMVW